MSQAVDRVLTQSLYGPVEQLFDRPGKMLRAQLVNAGYLLTVREPVESADPHLACRERLADVLEAIHAGSLIVDDIQDGSLERRGKPSMHHQYGMPMALNAGNWLYFQPFSWIRELDLPPSTELDLYRLCHEAMRNAHLGQAIDLGTRIDQVAQTDATEICLTSLRLKTGALTALALRVGSSLLNPSVEMRDAIDTFGCQFGMALQMFDDIGNFSLPTGHPKRWEDFYLRRPTWLWAIAAETCSSTEYARLLSSVDKLPDERPLANSLSELKLLYKARETAEGFLQSALSSLRTGTEFHGGINPRGLAIVNELAERVRTSYGKS